MIQTRSLDGVVNIDITDNLVNGQPWRDTTGRAELLRIDNTLIVDFFNSRVRIKAIINTHLQHQMNFEVQVPHIYKGRVQGLLGNFDDNRANEFYTRNGEPVPGDGLRLTDADLLEHLTTCKLNINE